MGKLVDLEEKRQEQRLRKALLEQMTRLKQLSERYRTALLEQHRAEHASPDGEAVDAPRGGDGPATSPDPRGQERGPAGAGAEDEDPTPGDGQGS